MSWRGLFPAAQEKPLLTLLRQVAIPRLVVVIAIDVALVMVHVLLAYPGRWALGADRGFP